MRSLTRKTTRNLNLPPLKQILVFGIGCCFVLDLWLVQFSKLSNVAQNHNSSLSQLASSAFERSRRPSRSVMGNNESKSIIINNQSNKISSGGQLPQWIQNYVAWHTKNRKKFPGQALFDDRNAPPLLIRTCLGLCGGLNDRIGQLPWDIYLANQTGRVLLVHWHRPVPLENFLVPGTLDWRVPPTAPGFFPQPPEVRVSRNGMKVVRAIPELFEGYDEAAPTADFWNEHLDNAIQRATTGNFRLHKILRHRLLGHLDEKVLEERLSALGESDMIHNTTSFGQIFRLFFQPSPNVQVAIESVYEQLKLRPHQFGAVHVRVRHPKATPKNVMVLGKNEEYTADKTGLPWEGATKEFAIAVANRAVMCARKHFNVSTTNEMPLYFYSDSNDLVRYMVFEENDPSRFGVLVARKDYETENAHIDKQKGRDPPAYYNTFVDLLVAADAQCIALGVGNFAVLASKISGTQCKVLYEKEAWGANDKSDKFLGSQICDLPHVEVFLKE